MIRACTATSVELSTSGLWVIVVDRASTAPVVTVTLPDGTTVLPDVLPDGSIWLYAGYRAEYVVTQPGRHIAQVVTTADGSVGFTAFVTGLAAAADMPTVDDVDHYIEDTSYSLDDMQQALDAEAAAQRRVCDVPAAYPPDLREALLRRCWRNLAMRGQPGLTVPGADDAPAVLAPGSDPEVRRLERPFRKLVAR